MPIPPNGSSPSNGDVDFGTGKYLIAGVHSSELTTDTSPVASVAEATSTDARPDDIGITDDDERADDKADDNADGKLAEDAGKAADETATDGSDDESGTATGTAADDRTTFAEDCTAFNLAEEDCTTADDRAANELTGAVFAEDEDGVTGAEADDFAAEEGGAEDTAGAVAADDTAVEAELTGGTS